MVLLNHHIPSSRCFAASSVTTADQWHVDSDGLNASGLKVSMGKGRHQFLRHVTDGILVSAGWDFPKVSNILIMEFDSHQHGLLFLAQTAVLL